MRILLKYIHSTYSKEVDEELMRSGRKGQKKGNVRMEKEYHTCPTLESEGANLTHLPNSSCFPSVRYNLRTL